jgi:phage T7 capsid assembly protein
MDIVANAQNNTQIVEAEPMTEDQQQVQTEAQPQVENTQTETTEVTATTAVDAQTNNVQEAFAQQQQATEELQKDLAERNVDFKSLEDEYNKNGQLSSASLEALANAGYPKEVVDAYISGVEATQEKFYNAVVGFAGGEDEYRQVAQFVSSQGDKAVQDFNDTINTGNLGVINMVIQGVKANMKAVNGTTNQTILGQSTGGTADNTNAYLSKQQMLDAMNDPRYDKDPIYRKQVEQKIINSNF